MTFVGLFLLGLVVAGVFDWLVCYSMNIYRLPTAKQKRQAVLVAFAIHGPGASLAFPLFLGGMIDRWLVDLGMKPELAWFASLWVMGLVVAVAIWLVSLLPVVRRAQAASQESMMAGHSHWNGKFGRAAGNGSSEKSS